MSQPSGSPLRQHLQLLLGGYGFNFYGSVDQARADDLLVRQAVSGRLTAASAALTNLEQQFRKAYIPPSTRENPYPPASEMQSLREIGVLKTRIGDIEARLRGMPVPTQDKIWWRFRDEQQTLEALLSYDRLMIDNAEAALVAARSITAEQWHQGGEARAALDQPLGSVESTIQLRSRLLQIP